MVFESSEVEYAQCSRKYHPERNMSKHSYFLCRFDRNLGIITLYCFFISKNDAFLCISGNGLLHYIVWGFHCRPVDIVRDRLYFIGNLPALGFYQCKKRVQMPVDELDLKIMKELEDDARQPVQALARKLGTKRTTTRNRLNRLIAENILTITCIASPEALGYQYILIMGINASSGKAKAVAKKLVQIPAMNAVYLAVGRFNILAAAILKDRLALTQFVSEDLGKLSGITSIEMLQSFQRLKDSWRYFKPQIESFDRQPPADPSEFDLSIIKAMELDPRQTITKLASTVGCSKSMAKTRLESLMSEGIIRFVSIVDPTALGYDIGVMILIKSKPDKTYAVANTLSMLTLASHVSLTTSQWQIVVLAHFQNIRHMDLFLSETLPSLPGITEIEVVHLLKMLKYSPSSGWFDSL